MVPRDEARQLTPPPERAARERPWWLLAAAALGGAFLLHALGDPVYRQILPTLLKGVRITLLVTAIAYAAAAALGLLLALAARSRHAAVRQAARFYVEIVRGVPILVLLLYVAFVLAPALVAGWNALAVPLGAEPAQTRDLPLLWRATGALALAYSAFLAEIFRAGLESVPRGQIEAAEALGLRPGARFRHVVFRQALRTVLPPLGNDLVAMVKDSSLVSVLGVLDITQLGKVTAAGNFRYFETYNTVAFLYLTLTITLSLLLRRLEQRLARRPGPH